VKTTVRCSVDYDRAVRRLIWSYGELTDTVNLPAPGWPRESQGSARWTWGVCTMLSSFVRRRQHARHLCRRSYRAFSGLLLLRSLSSSGVARLQACIVPLYSIIICSSCWEGDKKAWVCAIGRSSRVVWWWLKCRRWPARRIHGRRFFAKFDVLFWAYFRMWSRHGLSWRSVIQFLTSNFPYYALSAHHLTVQMFPILTRISERSFNK